MHGLGDSYGMVSQDRRGLPCRADTLCPYVSVVRDDLASTLQAAALTRNTHEHDVHAYTHVPIGTEAWSYTARLSKRGRSTLA